MMTMLTGQKFWAHSLPPVTVPLVDLEKYQGRWYSVALRRDVYYQAVCLDSTRVDYTIRQLRGETVVDVFNRCRRFLNLPSGSQVTARVADPDTNATLYIPSYGGTKEQPNYSIVALGEPSRYGAPADRYSWVLITGPDLTEAWIMVRDVSSAPEILREAAPAAEQAGLDLSTLYLEPHVYMPAGVWDVSRGTTLADFLMAE
jgi:lipocalin